MKTEKQPRERAEIKLEGGKSARYAESRAKVLDRRDQPEFQHQCAFVSWCRLNAKNPDYPGIGLIHSSLNGVKMTKAQAMRAKRAGMLAGVPDLFLPVPAVYADGSARSGLFIEMKSENGRLPSHQERIHCALREQGFAVVVCYGFDDAVSAVKYYYGVLK